VCVVQSVRKSDGSWQIAGIGEGVDLLDYGQSVIAGMKHATGQGDPETGEVFGQTKSAFEGVNATLRSAAPIDWHGRGSSGYADQNTRQQVRAEAMADADQEVHRVLRRQAAQIALRRSHLDDQCNFVANISFATNPMQLLPSFGEAMKLTVEITALQTALGESCHQINQLRSEVAQNAAELQQAVGRYAGVADGAELPSTAEPDRGPDRLQTPVAARLDDDIAPGPPAGPPPRDGQ
jgi:ESX secretion-associated protein EspA/E